AKDYAENLIDGANAMVVGLDTNGEITLFNAAAERITGYTLADLKGRNWFEALVPRQRYPQVWEAFERLGQGAVPEQFENPVLTRSGEERLIAWRNSTVYQSGVVVGGLSFGIDVTDTRRSEDLRLAKEGAEAASRAKSAFLANMSHELRTPLNAILGYSEMLAEEAPADMREDLQRIHGSGRHLLQVINAMLDIARIEAGMVRVEIDAVEVRAFAAEALAAVRTAATQKGLTLDVTIGAGVHVIQTDRVKLLQVLRNLLANAVKFTERGHVTLGVEAAEADGRPGVVFAVRDSGIGIPAEMLARLFQDFAQVDESTTRRFGGTGLGLALCRRLCGLLGGRVAVESTFGAGSTFTVWVPLAGVADADAEAATRLVHTGDAA
ncbi:MAG: PAS domain S-box protein, partial [Acidobacteria bacterium]|nr:PAS domain S-box protein [Acidobacteriota bacterium]